jgi:hypothetical protein
MEASPFSEANPFHRGRGKLIPKAPSSSSEGVLKGPTGQSGIAPKIVSINTFETQTRFCHVHSARRPLEAG